MLLLLSDMLLCCCYAALTVSWVPRHAYLEPGSKEEGTERLYGRYTMCDDTIVKGHTTYTFKGHNNVT